MNQYNNLLTIFILLICSTCAQAQSNFSTVINLPENLNSPNPIGFSGNSIGDGAEIFTDTQLNVSDGGSVGDFFNVSGFNRSGNIEVNISGGTVGSEFNSIRGSTVNISGGTIGDFFSAVENTINISDGTIGTDFFVQDSTVSISGGSLGFGFEISDNSTTNISGGTVDGFRVAFGSIANITEGTVGELQVDNSTVNISGGIVGEFSETFEGTVNLSAGSIGDNFQATESTVNISGGSVGVGFDASDGSTINITGGTIGDNFGVSFGGTVNVSGGNIGAGFSATPGSEVNIFGTEFFLNGTPVEDLILGQTTIISERGENGVLSGLLADGTSFEFDLNDGFDSTLRITRVAGVPEPGSGLILAITSILWLSRRRKKVYARSLSSFQTA